MAGSRFDHQLDALRSIALSCSTYVRVRMFSFTLPLS